MGILDFIETDNKLIVSSYDGNLEIFEFETFLPIKEIKKIGSCWKMVSKGQKIFCACMYDGLKVLDLGFNILEVIPTKTICYGLCLAFDRVYWSCFYSKLILYSDAKCFDNLDQ